MNSPSGSGRGGFAREHAEALNRAVRFYRIFLRVALSIMMLLFANTLLAELPKPRLDALEAYIIFKLTLLGYMYCWFFGCNRDLSVQNDLFRSGPKPTINEIALAALIVAGFAFLFYVESLALLSAAFLLFLAANVAGWLWLRRLVRPHAAAAARFYADSRDAVGQVKTMLYEEYMFGRWQWWRFVVGFAVLSLLTAVAYGPMTVYAGVSRELLFSIVTLAALALLETWIWYKRLRLKIEWDGLDWLFRKGFLAPEIPGPRRRT